MDNLFKLNNKKYLKTVSILLFSLVLFILLIFLNNSNVCSNINSNYLSINNQNLNIEKVKDVSWHISIPKINLDRAVIEEGIEDDILSRSIGHFDDTDIYDGNVCLAAHNRGNKVNYFKDLNSLQIGDKIYYNCKYGSRIYDVESMNIIDVYDFSCTEKIDDKNVITLITCVENNPNKRLCIRGVERSI